MAWYDDKKSLTHIATYKNDRDASKDANKAAQRGWQPQTTAATEGHLNLGRTATGAILTGGLSLLFGGSRTSGKLTLMYHRSPEWHAARLAPAA
jgi:hypothetical protein